MSKAHEKKNLFGQRALLAVSLAASITAFGCTTDRHLGNGDPVVTPGLRTTPTSSPTTGSETGTTSPMFSSSRFADTSIRNGAPALTSPAGAAAVMAEVQPRVRVLGQTTEGATPPGYYSSGIATGQFQNPALVTNPQLTINSSISSAPVPAISSGAGGAVGGGVSGAVVVGGTTGAAVIGSTTAAGTVAPTALSPTAASSAVPAPGAFATGVSPTAVSAATPSPGAFATGPSPTAVSGVTTVAGTTASVPLSPTAASVATPAAGVGNSPALAAAASRRTAVNGSTATTAAPRATRTNATGNGNVRIVTDESGRAVVTNSASRDQ